MTFNSTGAITSVTKKRNSLGVPSGFQYATSCPRTVHMTLVGSSAGLVQLSNETTIEVERRVPSTSCALISKGCVLPIGVPMTVHIVPIGLPRRPDVATLPGFLVLEHPIRIGINARVRILNTFFISSFPVQTRASCARIPRRMIAVVRSSCFQL